MSSQISCCLKFPLPSGGGSPPPPKKRVAQNDVKHILVLEFLRSDDFFLGGGGFIQKLTSQQDIKQVRQQPYGHYGD